MTDVHYAYVECNRIGLSDKTTRNEKEVICENCLAILEHAYHYKELSDKVAKLEIENEQLREVNSQTWCAYCEKTYPRTPDSMEQIREHISICEKHPMRKLEAEIMELSSALAIYADSNNWTLHMAAASSLVDPRSAEWDGPGYGPQIAKETLDSFVRGEILCPDCAGSGEVAGDYFADDGMATCDKCKGKGKVTP